MAFSTGAKTVVRTVYVSAITKIDRNY